MMLLPLLRGELQQGTFVMLSVEVHYGVEETARCASVLIREREIVDEVLECSLFDS